MASLACFEQHASTVDRPVKLGGPSKFWNDAEPVFNDAGKIIRGGFWDYQKEWWNLPNFIKILVAGYGAGKTLAGAKRVISLALQNAPCPVAYVAPTFPLARQTGVATIRGLLAGKQGIYGRQLWWRYNKSTHEFKIKFRGREATIIVYSGDDPLSLRGPNLAGAWLDEPFIMHQDVFDQMIARVRHPDAVRREITLTGTPEQLNWGYDLCVGELKDRHDVGFVRGSTRGNKVLVAQGYIQQLEASFTDKAAEAYIDGAFVQLGSGLIYYAFGGSNGPNVVDLPIPSGAEIGCGMDFNVNPFAFTLFWRAGNHIHFFAEHELPNADTEYACQMLREWYVDRGEARRIPEPHTLTTVYPDATGNARKTAAPEGKTDFWYIRQAGFDIVAKDSNPKVRDRENAVNGKLKPKLGQPSLTVSPKCKKLAKYLSTANHEQKNKEAGKKMSHLLDAFGYPVVNLFPINHGSGLQVISGF